MKPKQIVIEPAILISLFALVTLGIRLIWMAFFRNLNIEIGLHDTYLSLPFNWLYFGIIPFLLVTVIVYLIRALLGRFKNQLVNTILVISNLALTILLLKLLKIVMSLEQNMVGNSRGWTIYPPLSALPDNQLSRGPGEHPNFDTYVITFISIFILILVVSSILTGKNWNAKTHEQNIS